MIPRVSVALPVRLTVPEIVEPFAGVVILTMGKAEVLILMPRGAEAVAPVESLTCAVKEEVAATVGVPEMVPLEDTASPTGNEPLVSDQVYGEVPPLADRVWP